MTQTDNCDGGKESNARWPLLDSGEETDKGTGARAGPNFSKETVSSKLSHNSQPVVTQLCWNVLTRARDYSLNWVGFPQSLEENQLTLRKCSNKSSFDRFWIGHSGFSSSSLINSPQLRLFHKYFSKLKKRGRTRFRCRLSEKVQILFELLNFCLFYGWN